MIDFEYISEKYIRVLRGYEIIGIKILDLYNIEKVWGCCFI